VGGKGRPGRPEGPIAPAAGAAAKLAAQLRQLREDAGRPSYRQLARTAFYSHSALSQAAAGRDLPSLAVTLAFAEACGGDRQEWTARWHEAAETAGTAAAGSMVTATPDGALASHQSLASHAPPACPAPASPAPPTPRRRGVRARLSWVRWGRGRGLAVVGLACALLGLGISSLGGIGMVSQQHGTGGGLTAPVVDGVPPSVADCFASSRELGHSQVQVHGMLLGMVQLRYSRRCGTVWARFDSGPALADDGAVTVTLEVIRMPDGTSMVFRGGYSDRPQLSDVLFLHGGCARARVTITRPDLAGATGATRCLPPP
jgi:hypothetical protein